MTIHELRIKAQQAIGYKGRAVVDQVSYYSDHPSDWFLAKVMLWWPGKAPGKQYSVHLMNHEHGPYLFQGSYDLKSDEADAQFKCMR